MKHSQIMDGEEKFVWSLKQLPICRKDAKGAKMNIVVASITVSLEFHQVCPPAHSSKTPEWWADEDVEPDSTSATNDKYNLWAWTFLETMHKNLQNYEQPMFIRGVTVIMSTLDMC